MRDTLVMKFSRRLEIFFFLFISDKSCSVLMECQKIKIHFCSSEKKTHRNYRFSIKTHRRIQSISYMAYKEK